MQATIFWLTGVLFFAVQAAMLLYLMRARREGQGGIEGDRVEIVWTLVPAAMLVALVLMISGLTSGSWTRVRGGDAPLASNARGELRVLTSVPAVAGAIAEAR